MDKNRSSRIVIQFFSLLRSGLWGKQPDLTLFSNETDWKPILGMAQKQTVLGVVLDGVSGLRGELQPDKPTLLKAHTYIVRTAQHHRLLDDVIKELCARLNKVGIRSVLLKGQGLARNYPDPLKRTCGDIDLYVGGSNYRRTCKLLKQWGMLEGEHEESILHLHFDYRKVPVEIHRIAGVLYGLFRNRRFRIWSDSLLQGDDCREMDFNGQTVLLPPVRFDTMFVFYHMYRHLITGGVGLRQLCDWVMYLHQFRNEIDHGLLHKDLCDMGLMRAWQVFGCIAVNQLGLPQEEFPFYSNVKEAEETSLFLLEEVILRNGNFGFYNPDRGKRPDGYLAGKFFSLKNTLDYLRKMYRIFGGETWSFFAFYLFRGIGNVLKDVFRGRRNLKEKEKYE